MEENKSFVFIVLILLAITIINVVITNTRITKIETIVKEQQNSDQDQSLLLNDMINTVKAVDRKSDDIQTQRYYEWIQRNHLEQSDIEKIPECVFNKSENQLDVAIITYDLIRFNLDKQYTLQINSDKSIECHDLFVQDVPYKVVDCESICNQPTNETEAQN